MQLAMLTTERLALRKFEESDLEAYASMRSDPEVAQFLGDGKPLSRSDAWRQIALILGHRTLRGFGLWAVEERAMGRLLGGIGCHQPQGRPGGAAPPGRRQHHSSGEHRLRSRRQVARRTARGVRGILRCAVRHLPYPRRGRGLTIIGSDGRASVAAAGAASC